jgi:hypothetical protein
MYDYQSILENEPRFTLVYIAWPEGGGERIWAHVIEEGVVLIDNNPLYAKYRWRDIVRVTEDDNQGLVVGEILQRLYPLYVCFDYQNGKTGETDYPIRKLLLDACDKIGGVEVRFPALGVGFVLGEDGVSAQEIVLALRSTGIVISKTYVVHFNEETGKHTMEPVSIPVGAE